MTKFGTNASELSGVSLSMKVRTFFFDRMILEKLFDGKLRLGKDFPKLQV